MTPPIALFERMKTAIEAGDEALFKAQWHAEGFESNLTGSSGLAGRDVFEQGSRKKWILKPDLAKAVDGIVPCEIWAWEKAKAVDRVHILVVKDLVLGGGENLDEVRALAGC